MNVAERAKGLILRPRAEWVSVAAEPQTVQDLYTRYVMALAAIPAVAQFVGLSLVGIGGFRVPIGLGVAHMIAGYVLTLAGVYVAALVIDCLAPHFGGRKDLVESLKVAAFAPTAAWLTGAFHVVPALGIVALLGALHSVYALHVGLGAVKRPTPDKAVPYTAVVVIPLLVVGVAIGAVSALLVPAPVRGF